jgi:CHU_C Type IX secretion signal domain
LGNIQNNYIKSSDLAISEYPITFESRIQPKFVFTVRKALQLLLIFILGPTISTSAQAGCVEAVWLHAVPVQCNSFRNGYIVIDSVKGGVPPYYFSIDGVTFSTRPVFDFLWPDDYMITVRDSLGCDYETFIEVTEPPVLSVSLTASDLLVPIGGELHLYAAFEPTTAHLASISWRPPLLFDDNNALYQKISLTETTTIAIEIEDENGCTARDQVVVEVEKPNIFIPNVIMVGSNTDAYFTVFTDENIDKIKLLRVYARDGSVVFERSNFQPNDPLLGWNGRLKGKKVQSGVYTWLMQVDLPNGKTYQQTGTLTVLR